MIQDRSGPARVNGAELVGSACRGRAIPGTLELHMMTRRSMLLRSLASAALLAASRFLPMPSRPDDSKRPAVPPSLGASVYVRQDGRLTLERVGGPIVGVVVGECVSRDGTTESIVHLNEWHHFRDDPTDGSVEFRCGSVTVHLA